MHRELLSAATTTGAGTAITWHGGGGISIVNLLGGGRVDLEISADGTNYEKASLSGSTGIVSHSTGDGVLQFAPIPQGYSVRANAITASSTGVTHWVSQ